MRVTKEMSVHKEMRIHQEMRVTKEIRVLNERKVHKEMRVNTEMRYYGAGLEIKNQFDNFLRVAVKSFHSSKCLVLKDWANKKAVRSA